MRAVIGISLAGLVLGLAAYPAGADERKDRTAELEGAARAFLSAYQAKDLDALTRAADIPFLVGTVRAPKTFKRAADLRAELKARLSAGGKLPPRVAKTVTWDQAIPPGLSPDEQKTMRERLKPAIAVTGEDGGYAVLADTVKGRKGKSLLAISDTRLLVAVRNGTAKVVGILAD
jgi:hypothetical protein